MKYLVFLTPLFAIYNLFGQAHDVYLTGNLIDLKGDEGLYQSLDREFANSKNEFTLVLNGDQVDYVVDSISSGIQEARFARLIDIVSKYEKGKMVIMMGDRDWDNNGPRGFEAVQKLEKKIQRYIHDKEGYENIHLLSQDGCPGPYELELDVHLMVVAVNSHWWNHKYDKPTSPDAICDYSTTADIIEELEDIIDENDNKNVLLVAHHPIKSLGNYGGRYSVSDQLKPFPIVGTFLNAYRQNVGSQLDLSNAHIEEYIDELTNTLFFRSNIIMATSHEKNQQIMKSDDNFLINSGALGKGSYAATDYTTVLAERTPGVIKIEYKYDGTINAHFLELNKKSKSFEGPESHTLYSSACVPGQKKEGIDDNLAYISCQLTRELPTDVTIDITKLEQIKAGPQYNLNSFGRFWMGDHYRDEWSTDIGVRYLNVDTSFNGLQATKVGGGRQTMSLKFKSADGDFYTFRSVDKDPSRSLNYRLRYTILGEIFKDQTSAQHPYGALVVAHLLDKIGILHVDPKLYLMPDITALGPFQKKYGGMLGMIERNPGKANNAGDYFGGADDILKSHKLFKRMFKSKKHKVDEQEYLRARLFDILVGDWSRHEDNWKWAEYDQDTIKLYRPIPRDRDHVFAKWDGALPSLADREWGLPNTENFDYKIRGFKSLVYQARYIDRFLLTESTKADFIKEAKFIQEHIIDGDIDLAVRSLPTEIYDLSGEVIYEKIKARKDDLVDHAIKYHQWLNEEVEILGSRKSDYILINQTEEDGLVVSIYDEKDGCNLYYSRTFYPEETKQIRIYSLGQEDEFEINLTDHPSIDIVLIGGREDDRYLSNDVQKGIQIYDQSIADIQEVASQFEIVNHWNGKNYEYDRNRLKFDSYYPLINLGYSSFDGITVGGGASWTNYKWNKDDEASKHRLTGTLSTKGNLGFSYSGKFKEVIKRWDFISNVDLFNPEFYNSFYGLGNGTKIDDTRNPNEYYVANYNKYSARFGLSHQFWERSYFNFTSGLDIVNNKEITNSIVGENTSGLLGAHRTLSVLPFNYNVELDFRDHSIFPKRGIRAMLGNTHYYLLNDHPEPWHGVMDGSIEYYTSTYGARPLTLGLKVGGSLGYGDIPFYQLPHLGNRNGLRGYTSYRFTGKSRIFLNSELRWSLFELDKTFANQVGISAFYDIGRVYDGRAEAIDFDGFHSAYGGGIFITPAFRSMTLSIQLAWSGETSFYPVISLGTALR